jgi:hypothetical protein
LLNSAHCSLKRFAITVTGTKRKLESGRLQ